MCLLCTIPALEAASLGMFWDLRVESAVSPRRQPFLTDRSPSRQERLKSLRYPCLSSPPPPSARCFPRPFSTFRAWCCGYANRRPRPSRPPPASNTPRWQGGRSQRQRRQQHQQPQQQEPPPRWPPTRYQAPRPRRLRRRRCLRRGCSTASLAWWNCAETARPRPRSRQTCWGWRGC